MITREASAVWNKNLKQGNGTMRFGSVESSYTFASRFESGDGTNPEELLGAAHAGCFSMAFANKLDQAGHAPESVRTTARVNLDTGAGKVTRIDLHTEASVPGISDDEFQRIAEDAKANCPISKTLSGVEIVLDAKLAG
jgi:lipoyl-dependent peroxiredoxin